MRKQKTLGKFELDWESADRITLQSLEYHLEILKEDLKKLKEADSYDNAVMAYLKEDIYVFKKVIKYYGG